MNIQQFSDELAACPNGQLRLQLPSGTLVPAHFHITEVGKVTKDFIDCGGVRRSQAACVLQTFVADDVDHRLTTDKLSRILSFTGELDIPSETAIELEVQGTNTIELYSLDDCRRDDSHLTLVLAGQQTACLATDKCGIGESALPLAETSCCGDSGCC